MTEESSIAAFEIPGIQCSFVSSEHILNYGYRNNTSILAYNTIYLFEPLTNIVTSGRGLLPSLPQLAFFVLGDNDRSVLHVAEAADLLRDLGDLDGKRRPRGRDLGQKAVETGLVVG